MAALSGAAVDGASGGIIGGLLGLGIPEYEVKRYEGNVRAEHLDLHRVLDSLSYPCHIEK
jgi:hypothetical protein